MEIRIIIAQDITSTWVNGLNNRKNEKDTNSSPQELEKTAEVILFWTLCN